MKPEGRKHYKHPAKRDSHPKKGYMNWWEDVCGFIPRATRKLLFKREFGNTIMEKTNYGKV